VCAVSYEIVQGAAKRLRGDPRVISLEPSSLDDVLGTIAFLGDLVDRRAGAAALIASLRERIERLRASTGRAAPAPRVLVLEWTDPPMGAGHWTPGLVELAGGVPVLGTPGANSATLAWDAIAAADPDVVLAAPCGFDLPRALEAVAALDAVPQWRALRAVHQGRVYAIDGSAYVNRPGPRLVDSAEIFAACLRDEPVTGAARIAIARA
jgi:iron complex transport system substrate-binding protein